MTQFNNTSFGIMIIGDEILSGRRKDKHLEHSINLLNQHDFQLAWARIIGDELSGLVKHIREIQQHQQVCFSFGGIGATVDDRTRQAMATALGRPLTRHPDAAREIEAQYGEKAYPQRITMANLPEGAQIIPNPYNRVPGFSIDNFHCLPGFPEMAWPMMEWVLKNHYQHLARSPVCQHSFLLYDATESDLVTLLEQFQNEFPSVKISSLPRLAGKQHRHVEIGIQGLPSDVDMAESQIIATLKKHQFSPTKI